MKPLIAVLLVIPMLGLAVPALAQGDGEAIPRIVDVTLTIGRYNPNGPRVFVPFDPDTDLAFEFDIIEMEILVVDDDLAEEDAEEEFYYILSTSPLSAGPPAAAWIPEGSMRTFRRTGVAPVPPPPANAVRFFVQFALPPILGPSQQRLRGLQDFDTSYFVTIRVSNDEDPELGAWGSFIFPLFARKNPLVDVPNAPPFADAGLDRTVAAGTTVLLDGGLTFDADNLGFDPDLVDVFYKDVLEYSWEWQSGPVRVDPVLVPGGKRWQRQVTLDTVGEYEYSLTVEDGRSAVPSIDTVRIVVVPSIPGNLPPRARITGPTGPVTVGTQIVLSAATSTDPEGQPLQYRWRQTNEVGGRLATDELRTRFQPLSGLQAVDSTWQALQPGRYYFGLLVTDPGGLSDTASFIVEVIAAPAGQEAARVTEAQVAPATATPQNELAAAPTAAPLCGAGALLPLLVLPVALLGWRRRPRG
ncbi:MAG: hypothetical protein IPM18_14580 [Phycisphaerales bacterium]|nr:hypothetical protein [Phycisphaerales bacterium]